MSRDINKSLSDFEQQMNGLAESYRRTGEQLKKIGGNLTAAITLPLASLVAVRPIKP